MAALQPNEDGVVVLGKVVGAYGIKGWVRIHPFGDDPESWEIVKSWWFKKEEGAAQEWTLRRLSRMKFHSDALVALFEGVCDRTDAESLIGNLIGVLREDLPEVEANEFYWGDLEGLEVKDPQLQSLGIVRELLATGANTVLVVVGEGGVERLIPFVSPVVLKIDLEKQELVVDWDADW